MKKLASIFLSVVMLMSVLCMPTQAADQTSGLYAFASVDQETGTVCVKIITPEDATNGRFSLTFDAERLAYVPADTVLSEQFIFSSVECTENIVSLVFAGTTSNAVDFGHVIATISFTMIGSWDKTTVLLNVFEFNSLEKLNEEVIVLVDNSPAGTEIPDISEPPVIPDPEIPVIPTPEEPKEEVTTNPDGSVTTTVTDKDGTVTETTEGTDGSLTTTVTDKDGNVSETVEAADGTVTTTVTDKDGNKTETVEATDGTVTTTATDKEGTVTQTKEVADGTSATTVTDKDGNVTEMKAAVSEEAAASEVVTIPVEVKASENKEEATAVEITVPETVESVKVEIPVEDVTNTTVIVIVHEDGTEEILPSTALTEDGLAITVEGNVTVKVVDNKKEFPDTEDSWAKENIDFVTSRELFKGHEDGSFDPKGNMTRAQLVTVLARLAGVDTARVEGDEHWYDRAMAWAMNAGITDGSNPNGNITRQQMVTMLYRFAGEPKSDASLDAFADADQVDGWALDAMKWAVEVGIISGRTDGTLDPRGAANRAELAKIVEHFINL